MKSDTQFCFCRLLFLECGNDETTAEESACVLKDSEILPFVTVEGKQKKFDKLEKNVGNRMIVNAICDGVSGGLDRWTLYCDANSNDVLDVDETRQTYKLKQNPAKVRKKGVTIKC